MPISAPIPICTNIYYTPTQKGTNMSLNQNEPKSTSTNTNIRTHNLGTTKNFCFVSIIKVELIKFEYKTASVAKRWRVLIAHVKYI